MEGNPQFSFKKYRQTPHDHHPVNDAMGNVEALISIIDEYNIKGIIPA